MDGRAAKQDKCGVLDYGGRRLQLLAVWVFAGGTVAGTRRSGVRGWCTEGCGAISAARELCGDSHFLFALSAVRQWLLVGSKCKEVAVLCHAFRVQRGSVRVLLWQVPRSFAGLA